MIDLLYERMKPDQTRTHDQPLGTALLLPLTGLAINAQNTAREANASRAAYFFCSGWSGIFCQAPHLTLFGLGRVR